MDRPQESRRAEQPCLWSPAGLFFFAQNRIGCTPNRNGRLSLTKENLFSCLPKKHILVKESRHSESNRWWMTLGGSLFPSLVFQLKDPKAPSHLTCGSVCEECLLKRLRYASFWQMKSSRANPACEHPRPCGICRYCSYCGLSGRPHHVLSCASGTSTQIQPNRLRAWVCSSVEGQGGDFSQHRLTGALAKQ